MKQILLLSFLILSGFGKAQDLEERAENNTDNTEVISRLEIKEPIYQIKTKGCNSFQPAAYSGGVDVFKKNLSQYMYKYLNSDMYRLNGDFSFLITIDQKGKITDVEGFPKINNSRFFYDDMQYILRRMKTEWVPAQCNSKPIDSQIKIKMNFKSMTTEL